MNTTITIFFEAEDAAGRIVKGNLAVEGDIQEILSNSIIVIATHLKQNPDLATIKSIKITDTNFTKHVTSTKKTPTIS